MLDVDVTGYGTGTDTVPILVILIRFSFKDSFKGEICWLPPVGRGVEWEKEWLFLGVGLSLEFLVENNISSQVDTTSRREQDIVI